MDKMILLKEKYKHFNIVYIDESQKTHPNPPILEHQYSFRGYEAVSSSSNIMGLLWARGQEQNIGERYAFL